MSRPQPFVFMNIGYTYRGPHTWRQIKNEYFWDHLGAINEHMAKHSLTYEWKEKMIQHLVSICGWPKKQSWWQRLLAFLMF